MSTQADRKQRKPRTPVTKGIANLRAMFGQADQIDLAEGMLSYQRYNQVMRDLALLYNFPLQEVTAAFCTLSPNNDYVNNLRSVVTLLYGLRHKWDFEEIETSTYRHCLERAHAYVTGNAFFDQLDRGRKVLSFYHNILNPDDSRWVTVDGHVCAAWRGERLTMKEAIVRGTREYDDIDYAIKALACDQNMKPCQYQAVIWFTRKRVFNIKAELQHDLLLPKDDVWRTYRDVRAIKPFPKRRPGQTIRAARAQRRGGKADLPRFL